MLLSRRQLSGIALAAIPSKFRGVQIGAITYSFGSMPAAEIIPALATIGIGEVELMSNHCEALAGAPAPFAFPRPTPGSGRPQLTPEQLEAQGRSREALVKWRLATTPDTFRAVRKQFTDAGMDLRILCFNQRMNATDDEIEYAFQMAKTLQVSAISSSSTVSFAKRVAPFADRHKMMWSGHGHEDVKNPEEFATPQSFETILSYSKYIGVNLDIGHFTAAGFDPVSYLKQIHARVTNVHLKDRQRPSATPHPQNLPWGEADTPIIEVLRLMAREKYKFPANIELEYPIPKGSDRITEMKKCLRYCRDALA